MDGIELHVAEQGAGSPVVLLHGFPELWYSWRHQLGPLAAGGYRAIAPDLRGYGDSSAPQEVEAYCLEEVCGDCLALLDRLGEERAVFVGHDWGATVAWQLALAHPQRVSAVVGMSVPFVPRGPAPPVALLRQAQGEDFYIVWFQEPGDRRAGARARRPPHARHPPCLVAVVGGGGRGTPAAAMADRGGSRRLRRRLRAHRLPRRVELLPKPGSQLGAGRRVRGSADRAAGAVHHGLARPGTAVSAERRSWMDGSRTSGAACGSKGAGHWIQQERPREVNEALLGFLGGL